MRLTVNLYMNVKTTDMFELIDIARYTPERYLKRITQMH